MCRQCCCKSAQSCILFRDDTNHKLGQSPHFTVCCCFFVFYIGHTANSSTQPCDYTWHIVQYTTFHPQNTIWKLTSCRRQFLACSRRKHFSRSLISGPTLTHMKVTIFENQKGFKRRRRYCLISSFPSKCCCATAHRLTAPT